MAWIVTSIANSLLGEIAAWWSGYYGDHLLVSVAIRFLHLGGIVVGGGAAVTADREVWWAARNTTADREAILVRLHGTHPIVWWSLLLVGVTGILMAAADSDIFLSSRVYWTKMTLVALLIANGAALIAAERRVRQVGVAKGWSRVVAFSLISFVLWLLVLFMGVLLTVAA